MSAQGGIFLTGATGLLGRYLLRDLLAAGHPVTVLARDAHGRRAEERIAESVASWSDELSCSLPLPTVLAGELRPGDTGLTDADRRWLARRAPAVVHAAANLSFRTTPDGDPWRTNVEGTRALLQLCREARLTEWHHVSTAFVCGRRRTARESELDCGQDFHNPYEQSKFVAERAVRETAGLHVTVYRPSIIVGDSRTGHTTSYSGIYRFFEMAARLAAATGSRHLALRLPLTGDEPCDLVPVDWVSRAIAQLLARADCHGGTFHLTARPRTTTRLLYEVGMEELGLEGVELVGPEGVGGPGRLQEVFQEGVRDYWPYIGGCPAFDTANTAATLPHLPPPPVDAALLRRLIRFAVADRWGRRPARSSKGTPPTSSCAEYVEHTFPIQARHSRLAREARLDLTIALDVRGPGGGQWSCRWSQGELIAVSRGLAADAVATYQTDTETFAAIVEGRQTPPQAFFEQRIVITGDMETALKLAVLFGQFLGEQSQPDSRRTEAQDAIPL